MQNGQQLIRNAETANVRDETGNGTQTGNAELVRIFAADGYLQPTVTKLEIYI
jgi:hypothetical protein